MNVKTLFNKGSIPVLELYVRFTRARHEIIAHNIANITTPNYKTMDAPEKEFKQALLDAYQRTNQMKEPIFIFQDTNHIRLQPTGQLEVDFLETKEAGILKHNGNNVDFEIEMVRLLKNTGTHNLMASLLSQQYGLLRTAISERIVG